MPDQTLTLDDLITPFSKGQNFAELRKFLESKGFDYESVLLPGINGKMYSFAAGYEHTTTTASGDLVPIADMITLRMQDDTRTGKVTLMTPSGKFHDQIASEMKAKNFSGQEQTEKNKSVAYSSADYSGVVITLSTTQAVKEGRGFTRFNVAVSFES